MKFISIGPFPPPIMGMSYINDSFYNKIKKSNIEVIKIDTTFKYNNNKFIKYLIKPLFLLIKIFVLLKFIKYNKSIIYKSLSDSTGVYFDIIFILIARIFSCKIILHHHSSKHIIKYSLMFKIICICTKKNCTHICLTENMKKKLIKIYKIKKIISLSNIIFLNRRGKFNKKKKLNTVGFLANIIKEKGIFRYLDVIKKLENLKIKGLVGGPIHNDEYRIRKIFKNTKNLKYLGAINNKKKELFFKNIDILLFPSTLTEAEPLVILECLIRGIPVIAIKTGFINEILNYDSGYVFSKNQFVKKTLEIIIKFKLRKLILKKYSTNSISFAKKLNFENQQKFRLILKEIKNAN
tara:strand:+ start:1407 stop:2459 length:1053 start_codon:yes stop_codon:yes gene_type:complete